MCLDLSCNGNFTVRDGDELRGWTEHAPFDKFVISIDPRVRQQLTSGWPCYRPVSR